MCNGIAVVVLKTLYGIKVYCDPENGSHDKLLHKYVDVDDHNKIIKVEYIFPGEMHLDCPDNECKKVALDTGLVESALGHVLRLKLSTVVEIARQMPTVDEWPKELMQKANLAIADLKGADLEYVNLEGANLEGADLEDANLAYANLTGADLSGSNLNGANLRCTELRVANLRGANLRGANLSRAGLRGAILRNADLSGANLYLADLSGANLRGADLDLVDLSDTYGSPEV